MKPWQHSKQNICYPRRQHSTVCKMQAIYLVAELFQAVCIFRKSAKVVISFFLKDLTKKPAFSPRFSILDSIAIFLCAFFFTVFLLLPLLDVFLALREKQVNNYLSRNSLWQIWHCPV